MDKAVSCPDFSSHVNFSKSNACYALSLIMLTEYIHPINY